MNEELSKRGSITTSWQAAYRDDKTIVLALELANSELERGVGAGQRDLRLVDGLDVDQRNIDRHLVASVCAEHEKWWGLAWRHVSTHKNINAGGWKERGVQM